MNDDRGTHGDDAAGSGRHARREQTPDQPSGPAFPATEPVTPNDQAPFGSSGVIGGNGQSWTPGADGGAGAPASGGFGATAGYPGRHQSGGAADHDGAGSYASAAGPGQGGPGRLGGSGDQSGVGGYGGSSQQPGYGGSADRGGAGGYGGPPDYRSGQDPFGTGSAASGAPPGYGGQVSYGPDGQPVTGGGFGPPPAPNAAGQPGGPAASAPSGSASRDDATQPVGTDGAGQPSEDGSKEEPPGGRRAHRRRRKSRSWWIELPILLFFALVLALLIKTFVVQAFFIPSSSMENTLEIGDKVLVNKLVYDFRSIHRGDVVVFNGDGNWYPTPVQPKPALVRLWDSISGLFGTAPGAHDLIKRVIGVPGDRVACCDAKGRVTVNGVPLNEKGYLYPGNAPSETPFHIVVPPGRLWVMGDHRQVSYDSRGHMSLPGHGTVPENKVVGRAFVIIAPVSRWRILPIPATFQQPKLALGSAASDVAAGLTPGVSAATSIGALAGQPGGSLALGLVAAFPLTLAQRRLRRRAGALMRRGTALSGSGGDDLDSGTTGSGQEATGPPETGTGGPGRGQV
jgi:signal peptidase I